MLMDGEERFSLKSIRNCNLKVMNHMSFGRGVRILKMNT